MKPVLLIFENVIHFVWGDLEIVPSFEHVGSIEAFTYQSLDVFVFGVNFFDFGFDLFFFTSDLVKGFDSLGHFIHVLGFVFELGHDIVDEILNLLALGFDRILYDLNKVLDLLINVNFEHVFKVGNVDLEILDHVLFLVIVEHFWWLLKFLQVGEQLFCIKISFLIHLLLDLVEINRNGLQDWRKLVQTRYDFIKLCFDVLVSLRD